MLKDTFELTLEVVEGGKLEAIGSEGDGDY